MKKLLSLLLLLIIVQSSIAQNKIFDKDGHKISFYSEDLEIDFAESNIDISHSELAPLVLAAIPTVIDLGFRLTQKKLENDVKDYSAEYSKQKSYLNGNLYKIPDFTFSRTVKIDENTAAEKALEIKFKAFSVDHVGFVYYVEAINLKYSAAKIKSKFPTLDYTIELKINFLIDGEKKVHELSPIVISSVKHTTNNFSPNKHRTDIIPLPPNSIVSDISVKIVETNPGKVRAEKILSLWNENKDDAKTIINNFLPKDEDKENEEATPPAEGTETDSNADAKTTSSNKDAKKVNP